jgi:hypothetical protein
MTMGKLLALVLGLAAISFAVKTALTAGASGAPGEASRPKRQLDNVRTKAHELERLQQQQVDDVAKRTGDGQ